MGRKYSIVVCIVPLEKRPWLCPFPARCLKSERALLIFYKALQSALSQFSPSRSSPSLPSCEILSPLSTPQWTGRQPSHETIKTEWWKGFWLSQTAGREGDATYDSGKKKAVDAGVSERPGVGSWESGIDFGRSLENLDTHSHLQSSSLMGFHLTVRAAWGASQKICCLLCACVHTSVHIVPRRALECGGNGFASALKSRPLSSLRSL